MSILLESDGASKVSPFATLYSQNLESVAIYFPSTPIRVAEGGDTVDDQTATCDQPELLRSILKNNRIEATADIAISR